MYGITHTIRRNATLATFRAAVSRIFSLLPRLTDFFLEQRTATPYLGGRRFNSGKVSGPVIGYVMIAIKTT